MICTAKFPNVPLRSPRKTTTVQTKHKKTKSTTLGVKILNGKVVNQDNDCLKT